MQTINVGGARGVSLGLALLIGSMTAASGQTTFSMAGGLNVARTVPTVYPFAHGSTTGGFALQASVGRLYRSRLGWRVDVFASQFELTVPTDFVGLMCPSPTPPGACCGICPLSSSKSRVGVAGMVASQFVNVMPTTSPIGMYLMWGAETDYLYQHPNAHGALRLGASVGGGVTLPITGRFQAFVEARYHRLFDSPSQPTSLLPVTCGLRF
jgi:hypothetical protein